jgi:hypothetical protein
MMNDELVRNFNGSGRDLLEVLARHLSENLNQDRACPGQIRSEYLPNRNVERYR